MADTLSAARLEMPNEVPQGKYRDVVVMSGANPKLLDVSKNHRGELRKNVKRQDFSIRDPEAGIAFKAMSAWTGSGGHHSPRHRHNFDQVRFILEGEVNYAQRNYDAGWLGYFPESVPYGPHGGTEHREIVLQFSGQSRTPFFTPDQTSEAQRKLYETGATLEGGMCVWPDGRKQDGFEALWELMAGRPIEYPPACFREPIWINTNNFRWEETNTRGVSVKRIVQFSSYGPLVTLIRLEPGAVLPAGRTDAMMMRYIYQGEVEYKGESCPTVSSLYYPPLANYGSLRSAAGAFIYSVELEACKSAPRRMGHI